VLQKPTSVGQGPIHARKMLNPAPPFGTGSAHSGSWKRDRG
jgi:hypothetical protein